MLYCIRCISSKRILPKEPRQLNIPPACITKTTFTDARAFCTQLLRTLAYKYSNQIMLNSILDSSRMYVPPFNARNIIEEFGEETEILVWQKTSLSFLIPRILLRFPWIKWIFYIRVKERLSLVTIIHTILWNIFILEDNSLSFSIMKISWNENKGL